MYVLLLCLLATIWFATAAQVQDRDTAYLLFESDIGVIEQSISERLKSYENVLYGVHGLFSATRGLLTREQWRNYIRKLDLDQRYPGVQSTGFAKRIASPDLAAHLASIRAKGFANYAIHPAGERPEYYPVLYVEPYTVINSRVFGYDMLSESVRRSAMLRARDTGLASASGKITLVQDLELQLVQDLQFQMDNPAGFVMFLPVYQNNTVVPEKLEERRLELAGFVFSQFRLDSLMRGVLGREAATVNFQVFTGDFITPESLLYMSSNDFGPLPKNYDPNFNRTRKIEFAGQHWSLHFTSTPAFDMATQSNQPLVMVLAGGAISILLFGVLMQAQKRARQDRDFRQMVGEVKEYGIYMLDRHGRVTSWNKGAEVTEGYEAEEILGVHFSIFSTSEDRLSGEPARALEIAAREGRYEDERWRLRKDGTRFWANVVITALRDTNGNLRGFTKVTRDITARKQAETAIAAKNTDLETLLHVTSHDLREPLRAIESFSRLVHDRYASLLDDKGQDFLRRVVRAAKRMDQLLLDILTVSRTQRPGTTAENVSGEAIVRVVLTRLAQKVRETHAKIAVLDNLPRLRVDSTWATAAIYNLVSNALKFTRPGEAPDIEIGPYVDVGRPKFVGIAVRDRGPGLPPEHRERIFQLFQRAVGREVEGTGAGLAIVRRIAQRHDGDAWVEARPGGGSVFIITFAKRGGEESQDGR